MANQYDNLVLTFSPMLKCRAPGCTNPTDQGLLRVEDLDLYPVCAEHGYAYAASPEDERKSIERFVLFAHNHVGTAQLLGTRPIGSIPGYAAEDGARSEALAWACYWIDAEGLGHRQYVTWEPDYLAFSLYEEEEGAAQ